MTKRKPCQCWGAKELAVLRKRKQEMEDELAKITLQLASAAVFDSVREATTTASTCDCPAPETHHGGIVPYGSTDQEMKESSPLLNKVPPDHIVIRGYPDNLSHDWEECFSHVRSEEDFENEKGHNESEFYLNSSMFGRGKIEIMSIFLGVDTWWLVSYVYFTTLYPQLSPNDSWP